MEKQALQKPARELFPPPRPDAQLTSCHQLAETAAAVVAVLLRWLPQEGRAGAAGRTGPYPAGPCSPLPSSLHGLGEDAESSQSTWGPSAVQATHRSTLSKGLAGRGHPLTYVGAHASLGRHHDAELRVTGSALKGRSLCKPHGHGLPFQSP